MKGSGIAFRLILLLALLCVWASTGADAAEPPTRPLTAAEPVRVVVEKDSCECGARLGEADVVLVTLGTESWEKGQRHFHPIVSLAFDRMLAEADPGQWVALWNLGISPPGWRRTLRSFLPLPVGPPRASDRELARLAAKLDGLRADEGQWPAPAPYADLSRLKPATASHGIVMGLKRVVNWLGLIPPGQFFFRTHLLHRGDRDDRAFQRAYLGLAWLIDVEFDGDEEDTAWLRSVNDVRFHLLRNRSFFGRWVRHSESFELVYHYDSKVREELAKGSSWLQADANEYHLRYESIQRYTANGAAVPMGGILYYDPQRAPAPEQAYWRTPNVFDLTYNPFTHPTIQQRAREHPDKLIPLALYVFQSELGLRPIIAVDFIDPDNPRVREATRQGMEWLQEWLLVSAGFLAPERFAYRIAAYIANKKAFTLLVNRSARLGIEELRLGLESHLYFDPEQRRLLLRRVDKRVLNPLVKAAEVEAWLAELQYEALRADQAQAVCAAVNQVRRRLADHFGIRWSVATGDRWEQMRAALAEWQARRRMRDLLDRGFEELGTLTALTTPLAHFENHPAREASSAEVLRALYAALLEQERQQPPGLRRDELSQTRARVEQAWARAEAARGRRPEEFARAQAQVEAAAEASLAKQKREREEQRARLLRTFLKEAYEQLKQVGCSQGETSPADVEMYLEVLLDLPDTVQDDPQLAREFRKHERRLARALARLEQALAQCPLDERDPWRLEQRESTLLLVRAADRRLFGRSPSLAANGNGEE